MTSAAQTVKNLVSDTLLDRKTADLASDTFDPTEQRSCGFITSQHGVRVADTENWLKVNNKKDPGPSLLEDVNALEKIQHFDHERIPERVVHARGSGAHGHFRVFNDGAKRYTFAPVLTDSSRTTPTFVRFSTVQGSKGSADPVRDVRGFATKFYTQEGNWDIVGNNMPVFFIQDAIQFPDFVHAVKPEPHNEVPQGQTAHNNFWDFVNSEKSTTHMLMWAMSDRGIPRSFRMMEGFGVNTFTLINAKNERFFVKFHWLPELGCHSFVWDEALKVCGQDPDFHRKDLEEAILNGVPPKWTFGIQVIPESKQHDFDFDILDATKLWPKELVPVEEIGEMVLDRVVDEYFTETEQVAFCTSHIVPGIGFSDDPLLQGRNFSYPDTQITRLGTNWEELPINRPICPVLNNLRDGSRRHRITRSKVNYYPNRFHESGPDINDQGYAPYEQAFPGTVFKTTARGEKFKEYLSQAQMFYNSMSPYEKQHIVNAIGFELDHCDDPLVYKNAIPRLNEIDHDMAKAVALQIGGEIPSAPSKPNHGRTSKGLSFLDVAPKNITIKSRRIAVLLADGFDGAFVAAAQGALKNAGAFVFLIGPRRNSVKSAEGEVVISDHHLEGMRSTLFDAILVPPGASSASTLCDSGRAVHWIREAFGHCKAIAAVGEGISLVKEAISTVEAVKLASSEAGSAEVVESYGVVTVGKYDLAGIAKELMDLGKEEKGFLAQFSFEISKHRRFDREVDGLTNRVAY